MIGIHTSGPRFSAMIQQFFKGDRLIEMNSMVILDPKAEMPILYGVQVHTAGNDRGVVHLFTTKERAETVLAFVQDTNHLPRKLMQEGVIEFKRFTTPPTTYRGNRVILVSNDESESDSAF